VFAGRPSAEDDDLPRRGRSLQEHLGDCRGRDFPLFMSAIVLTPSFFAVELSITKPSLAKNGVSLSNARPDDGAQAKAAWKALAAHR